MSLWFKSPMSGKFQAFFFIWTLCAMFSFAMTGISISHLQWGVAGLFLLAGVLISGFGFMIRKRVLRSLGIVKQPS